MRSRYLQLAPVLGVLAAILSLAACGSGGTTTTVTTSTTAAPSPKDTFCADLKNVSVALTQLQGLSKSSSIADIKSAASSLKTAGQQLVTSAKALGQADVSAVQSTITSLQQAVKNLPSGNTIPQDLTQLQPALQAAAQSITKTFNGQGCKTSS